MIRLLFNETIIIASIILFVIFLITRLFIIKNNKKFVIYFLFSCYLVVVWFLVGLPDITYIRFYYNPNFIPFIGMLSSIKETLLNILLFIPMGFFLPLVDNKSKNIKHALLNGFLISLFIEVMQIFTFRATDINDLITNVSGTLIGYLIVKKIFKLNMNNDKHSLITILMIVFINMFIIIPILEQFF